MKKSLLSSLVLSLVAIASSDATVTVTVNSNGGPRFVTSTGVNLTQGGSTIRVGTFDISGGVNTIQTSNSFATLDALFTPLIENEVGGGNINPATPNHGDSSSRLHINDTATAGNVFAQLINIAGNYLPQGTQLYLWVFNNSNPSVATEWGIFSSTNVLWDFPPDNGSATLSSGTADVIHRGTLDGGALRLAAVPEPSVYSLLAVFGCLLIVRRRR